MIQLFLLLSQYRPSYEASSKQLYIGEGSERSKKKKELPFSYSLYHLNAFLLVWNFICIVWLFHCSPKPLGAANKNFKQMCQIIIFSAEIGKNIKYTTGEVYWLFLILIQSISIENKIKP